MPNLRMREKIANGEAIDLSKNQQTPEGYYILDDFEDGSDYCNLETESWIWSIGRHLVTGQILAAHNTVFYQNPDYECLFLR